MTIKWNFDMEALLGKEPDRRVAGKLGVSTFSVRTRRIELNIPPFAISGQAAAIEWTAEMDAQLGTASDKQVAKQLGLSRETVSARRRALGKPDTRSLNRSASPVDPSALILAPPTAAQIKTAREKAALTLRQSAELAGSPDARAWLRYESRERQMGADRWALFLLALGQHPNFKLVRR